MADILTLNGLGKSFGAVTVTSAVTLAVGKGEAIGIIGPNGAGKSSLFNLITGDIQPDAGDISFDGRKLSGVAPYMRARMGIGRSYQIPRPFAGISVFENLLVGARFAGASRVADPRAHCADILSMTGLRDMADQPAGRLTLLGRKRLELARALSLAPKILLLDEIAGGLTEAEARELVRLIRNVHAKGLTIIWIEHVLHALMPVISRLVVLAGGRLVAQGAPETVINEPLVRDIYLGHDEDAAP